MGYTAAHKQATRERILRAARELFNRKGYSEVSVNEVMRRAGLTHGGFYNHFPSKDALFVEAIEAYARENPTDRWPDVELDFTARAPELARQMIDAYLSKEHLDDVDGHCPMIAVPSDVARAGVAVRQAYESALNVMTDIFDGLDENGPSVDSRRRALGLAAVCVGGMVLARTVADAALADEIRAAARDAALALAEISRA